MIDLAVALGITLIVGIVLGAVGVHYIHKVANAANRAVTIPGHISTSLPAPLAAVAGATSTDLQQRVADLEAKFSTAAPKVAS